MCNEHNDERVIDFDLEKVKVMGRVRIGKSFMEEVAFQPSPRAAG